MHGNAEPVLTTLKEYLATNSAESPPFDVETLLEHGDGRFLWFRVRGQALWNKEGQAVRMAGSITDITERRNWEEEQARLIANLAIARDKAEKAAKARSEFLAVSTLECMPTFLFLDSFFSEVSSDSYGSDFLTLIGSSQWQPGYEP